MCAVSPQYLLVVVILCISASGDRSECTLAKEFTVVADNIPVTEQ